MKYSEIENFTYDELQNFTWGDLEKSPEVLKREIEKFGSKIPYDVYVKICKLCDDVKATPHRDCASDAQSDFSSDCIKTTQAYCRMARSFYAI